MPLTKFGLCFEATLFIGSNNILQKGIGVVFHKKQQNQKTTLKEKFFLVDLKINGSHILVNC